jgi:hypothetical protein
MRAVFLLLTVIYSMVYAGCVQQKVNTQPSYIHTESDFSGVITTNDSEDDFPILFVLNGLYGYVDNNLQVIVPPIYDRAIHYTEQGYTMVRFQERYGLWECRILDREGKILWREYTGYVYILCDDIISYIPQRSERYIVVKFTDNTIIANGVAVDGTHEEGGVILVNPGDGGYTFLDFSGRKILPNLQLRMPSRGFQEGRAVITDGNYDIRIIDINGNFYGNLDFYRTGRNFSGGLLPAETKDGRTGYVNKDGEFAFIVPILAEIQDYQLSPLFATDFKDGYALIQTDSSPSTWRIINKEGEYASGELPIFFADAFRCGLSCVKVNGAGYGFINTRGEMVIDPVFYYADYFHRGYARIIYQGRDGLINTEGQIFWSDELVMEDF